MYIIVFVIFVVHKQLICDYDRSSILFYFYFFQL